MGLIFGRKWWENNKSLPDKLYASYLDLANKMSDEEYNRGPYVMKFSLHNQDMYVDTIGNMLFDPTGPLADAFVEVGFKPADLDKMYEYMGRHH